MSDDQKHKPFSTESFLNYRMKTLMESIDNHAKQMLESERAQQKIIVHPSMITELESTLGAGGVAKSHGHNWQLAGVEVVVSEHAPPDRIMFINDEPLRLISPAITINPKEGFNEHAPTWEPNSDSLLQAVGHQLISTSRGHFNIIICADDSPVIPERPFVCWTCGDVFLSRKRKRQCAACLSKFYRDREQVMHDLKMIGHAHFYLEIRRLGKPCPTHNWPNPPYLTAQQTREKLAAAKKKRRRQKIKARQKLKTEKKCSSDAQVSRLTHAQA